MTITMQPIPDRGENGLLRQQVEEQGQQILALEVHNASLDAVIDDLHWRVRSANEHIESLDGALNAANAKVHRLESVAEAARNLVERGLRPAAIMALEQALEDNSP